MQPRASNSKAFHHCTTVPSQCVHQASGVWAAIKEAKQIILEPRETGNAFDVAITKHTTAIAAGRGSLLMAVCRGKVRWLGGWAGSA